MNRRFTIVIAAVALAFVFVARGQSYAQSLIMTQPGAPVEPSGKFFLEADNIDGFASFSHGGFVNGIARGVYGVPGTSDNLEVGLNFSVTKAGSPTPGELQPNIKYRLLNYDSKSFGLQVSAGSMLFLPVINGSKKYGGNTFGELYTVARLQTKFDALAKLGDSVDHSPAFSAGFWGLVNRTGGTGSQYGGIFGVEEPITSKLTAVADYSTGNQSHPGFSAASLGGLYALNDHITLGAAYIHPNTPAGGPSNQALFLFNYGF